MKTLFEKNPTYLTLKKPIFQNINEIRINSINSNEDDTTEDKKIEKEFSFPNAYIKNNSWEKINNDISSKINIIISKDDIMQEHKLLNSKSNLISSKNSDNHRKEIFLCIKRLHDEDDQPKVENFRILEKSDKNEKIKKNGSKKDKKAAYKKHDKMEKDNIVRKIQVHYCNFLINLMNEIIKKIIIDESYKTENADEIIHMGDYLFKNIDYKFKSNIKKSFMEKFENMKIKEIISPSNEFCESYKISNKNKEIMKKIELKNNPILNKILNQKYLYYFNEIYYQNKKNLDLNEEDENINIILSDNTKMFNDLVLKNIDDKNYISKLKRVAMQNFTKPKYMFKIKK